MKRRWMWWDTTLRDPGSYITVQHMVPNKAGNYESPPDAGAWGSGNTVTGTVINADAFQKTDGSARLFACTATKIYEVTSSAATDRSAGGGSYTTGTYWSGAQYGDVTIYTNRADDVQASSSGAFADLTGSPPKARYICTQSLAVVLAAYNDGVNTYEDGVWFSDIGDHTVWTPGANQAANLRLLQTPGPITALCAFKGDVLAWKANSFYRLSYVGGQVIWQAQLVSDNVGASGPGAICVCGDIVVFVGKTGWHVYDGSVARPIAPERDLLRVPTNVLAGQVTQYSVGGPYTEVYKDGQTFYHARSGLAYFAPNWSASSNDESIICVQVTPGDGFAAFGQFKTAVAGTLTTMRCLVRGTSAALMAAGIGDDNLSSGPYPAAFLVSSSDSVPYTLGGNSASTQAAGWVQTSWIGDPAQVTNWTGLIIVGSRYRTSGVGPGSTLNVYTSKKADLADMSMASPQATGVLGPDGTEWNFNKSARYICFASYSSNGGGREIEEFLPLPNPAGRH